MPTITKEELRGNPPERETSESSRRAAAPAKIDETTDRQAEIERQRAMAISPQEARDVGEAYVEHGAYDRAVAKVNARGANPAEPEPVERIVVDRDGKVIEPEEATSGGTVLTGAEATAYRSGAGKRDAGRKSAGQTANKARGKSATKRGSRAK